MSSNDKRKRDNNSGDRGICYTFVNTGSCEHGSRCRFSHDNSGSSGRPNNRVKGTDNIYNNNIQGYGPDEWSKRLNPNVITKAAPCPYTVSIAIPSSLLKNVQTRELKTYVVGQIARAAAIHEIDEIIVYMDTASEASAFGAATFNASKKEENNNGDGDNDFGDVFKCPSVFFLRVLQYLETPSYLRKSLFPVHYDLKFAGLLPPLDMPHHMRKDDISLYREGVTLPSPNNVNGNHGEKSGTLVNVGLSSDCQINRTIQPGVRVTVKIDEPGKSKKLLHGDVIAPTIPRSNHGLYWGYQARLATSLNEVFTGCPYEDDSETRAPGKANKLKVACGYDLRIGQSSNGKKSLDSALSSGFRLKPFKHLLIVFGGVGGLESSVDNDETVKVGGKDAWKLFDHYLDMSLSSGGGSRTVRTEEEVILSLAKITPFLHKDSLVKVSTNDDSI
jgi:predicted SPOUT superfamily RNA methylase MTH1